MTGYWWMASLVTFSAASLLFALATLGIALLPDFVIRRIASQAPAMRAAALLRLRLLPAAAAAIGAVGLVLPLFVWFEPVNTQERIARTLIFGGVLGLTLLSVGVLRGIRALGATARLARAWRASGRPLEGCDAPLPVFVVDEPLPAVAVVGFQRPELFISAQVLRDCPDDEVRAMIAHECAHVTSQDNLKRLLLRVCPGIGSASGALDRAWNRASEEAADALAASRFPELALPLAQALVRVARLMPIHTVDAPVSAFHPGGDVEMRVRRLLQPSAVADLHVFRRRLVWSAAIAVALASVIASAPSIHQLMEVTVSWLP